jgi:hypothetical protein
MNFLRIVAGKITEIAGLVVSSGAGDAGKIPALDAGGKLDVSLMPTGIGPDTIDLPTSENLVAGDYVNIYDNAGTVTARKADANGKEAHGFVLAAVTSPASASIYRAGVNNQLTGLTEGVRQYLSETAGQVTDTPPSTSGALVQYLGMSLSETELLTSISDSVTLA